jgi:DNA replication protein DnaC
VSQEPKQIGAVARALSTATHHCQRHGDYEAQGIVILGTANWSGCPKCIDEAEVKEQREEQDRKLASRLEKAGIPKRFADKDFSNYRVEHPGQTRALMTTKAYAADFGSQKLDGRCLILTGHAGTGKTHLAMAIVKAVLRQGFSARYTTVYECIERIRETWRPDSPQREREVVKLFTEVDLLVLDEVGVQYGKESEQVEMFKILNKRYEGVRPTVVISNLEAEDVSRYLGGRAFDRLRENDGKVVAFDWESERGK